MCGSAKPAGLNWGEKTRNSVKSLFIGLSMLCCGETVVWSEPVSKDVTARDKEAITGGPSHRFESYAKKKGLEDVGGPAFRRSAGENDSSGSTYYPYRKQDTRLRQMKLQASCNEQKVRMGQQLGVSVALVNAGDKSVELQYFRPWNLFPEVWDETGKKKLPDAPSCAYDQILQRCTSTLKQGEEIQLRAIPIVLKDQPLGAARDQESPGMRAYWSGVKPGKYRLRYTVDLKDFVPGVKGPITSNDISIEVEP